MFHKFLNDLKLHKLKIFYLQYASSHRLIWYFIALQSFRLELNWFELNIFFYIRFRKYTFTPRTKNHFICILSSRNKTHKIFTALNALVDGFCHTYSNWALLTTHYISFIQLKHLFNIWNLNEHFHVFLQKQKNI